MRESTVVTFSRPFDVNVCHDLQENVWGGLNVMLSVLLLKQQHTKN
ncbi:hypothetical protein RH201207_05363 [Klebsiella pneumoniae]|nr:hypothetical protein RH201207_05363 [Klebsiella pneumoniae]